jgi:hypothetical protein
MSIEVPKLFGEDDTPRIELSRPDAVIAEMVLDPEGSRLLHEHDPITWLRGAIAVDTHRTASEITDATLYEAYSEGGRFEWDPLLAKNVATYLASKGYRGILES